MEQNIVVCWLVIEYDNSNMKSLGGWGDISVCGLWGQCGCGNPSYRLDTSGGGACWLVSSSKIDILVFDEQKMLKYKIWFTISPTKCVVCVIYAWCGCLKKADLVEPDYTKDPLYQDNSTNCSWFMDELASDTNPKLLGACNVCQQIADLNFGLASFLYNNVYLCRPFCCSTCFSVTRCCTQLSLCRVCRNWSWPSWNTRRG